MERAQEPNLGLWSPPGGKLESATGESPHECAQREALEELGLFAPLSELRFFAELMRPYRVALLVFVDELSLIRRSNVELSIVANNATFVIVLETTE